MIINKEERVDTWLKSLSYKNIVPEAVTSVVNLDREASHTHTHTYKNSSGT